MKRRGATFLCFNGAKHGPIVHRGTARKVGEKEGESFALRSQGVSSKENFISRRLECLPIDLKDAPSWRGSLAFPHFPAFSIRHQAYTDKIGRAHV